MIIHVEYKVPVVAVVDTDAGTVLGIAIDVEQSYATGEVFASDGTTPIEDPAVRGVASAVAEDSEWPWPWTYELGKDRE